jgi:hypothetical protein
MNLNTYICDGDGWGWYVDIENSNYTNCINFIIVESYNNENSNKKMNYHLNRLETIHEYEYYEEDEKNSEENNENIENNKIKNVEKGFLIKTGLTTILTTIFTYLSSFIFKLVH